MKLIPQSRSPRARRRMAASVAAMALACAGATAVAADAPSDLDALSLESAPEQAPGAGPRPNGALFVEAAAARRDRRLGWSDDTLTRLSIDGRQAWRWGNNLQAHLSARVDATDPKDERYAGPVLSLREAYVGWQDAEAQNIVEAGRINLRDGTAYGYNPTDFFRANTLRTITTLNPSTLRENRLGTVMLRGQRNWGQGSLSLAYAPRLADRPSGEGLNPDLGATNSRHRGLLSYSARLSERFSGSVLGYADEAGRHQVGATGSLLASDAIVAHAEWSYGRDDVLRRVVLGLPDARRYGHRLATGATYTTATKLSLTAEYQYNDFALDRNGWQALRAYAPVAVGPYLVSAVLRQDIASRHALMLYATQRDLGRKNLDVNALLRFNASDRSRLMWLEVRYRMDRVDLALQLQHGSGVLGSEYGSDPVRSSIGGTVAYYF